MEFLNLLINFVTIFLESPGKPLICLQSRAKSSQSQRAYALKKIFISQLFSFGLRVQAVLMIKIRAKRLLKTAETDEK